MSSAPSADQISYNIVADGGAACNGDVQTVTRTASLIRGTRSLVVTANTFTSHDAGKAIGIPGAGANGGALMTTIQSVTSATSVTLTNSAGATLSSAQTALTFGTDDARAFMTFNGWARANQGFNKRVVLTVPSGANCWFGSAVASPIAVRNAWAAGINDLIVEGAGATLNSLGGSAFWLGGIGVCQAGLTAVNGCSARIESASVGDNQVVLTVGSRTAGYISRFPVGKWIMVGGLDVQGLWLSPYGYPPNNSYFEWRQVKEVNVSGGIITLDRPISKSYLSTWPSFNSGNNFEADAGGPATIWAVGAAGNTWNVSVEYRGLTISQSGQTYAPARFVTYRNVIFNTGGGGIPSQNESWTALNSSWPGLSMEVDKFIGTMTMDGATIGMIQFQSNSVDLFLMRNSTVTKSLQGGGKRTEITNSSINDLRPGSTGYGATQGPFVCTRCAIGTLATASGVSVDGRKFMTMSGGIISWPNSQVEQQRWASTVGTNFFYVVPGSFSGSVGVFRMLGVTADPWPAVDNQTVTTNVTILGGSMNLAVSSNIFTSEDVGKVILIPKAGRSGANLKTFITEFTDSRHVTLFAAASNTLFESSLTLQWGTSNVHVQTDQAGGFPATATRCCIIQATAAPQFTCDKCTGDPVAVAMGVEVGAAPLAPMGTYSKRNYAPTANFKKGGFLLARGKLVSLTIDVTQAYSGSGSALLNPTGEFHNFTIKQSDWSEYDWWPTINLKTVGTRLITPTGVTCNGVPGGCLGDKITAPPEAVWIKQGLDPSVPTAMVGPTFPKFTITIQTDQGIVP